jgi:hypothetical protein
MGGHDLKMDLADPVFPGPDLAVGDGRQVIAPKVSKTSCAVS